MEFTESDASQYSQNYSEQGFWEKIGQVGKKIAKPALLLYYTLKAPSTPIAQKTIIIGALGYLILPFDICPDMIPVLGFADDAAALAAVIKLVKDSITPEIEQQVKAKLKE